MIYFPDKQLVIITPPHTASGNLHRGLCIPEYGGQWILGLHYGEEVPTHHYAQVPASWVRHDGVKVYCVVRNPYDRMIGLFLHYNWFEKSQDRPEITFEQYVYNRPDWWLYTTTISRFLDIEKVEDFGQVKYENLTESLTNILDQPVELPKKYHPPNDIASYFKDPHLREHVTKTWAAQDCERYDYELL